MWSSGFLTPVVTSILKEPAASSFGDEVHNLKLSVTCSHLLLINCSLPYNFISCYLNTWVTVPCIICVHYVHGSDLHVMSTFISVGSSDSTSLLKQMRNGEFR